MSSPAPSKQVQKCGATNKELGCQYNQCKRGGRGQATEHARRELLELRAAPGSSDTIRGDQGSISLPEQPGWSLDDSEALRSRERARASQAYQLSHGVARPREKERLSSRGRTPGHSCDTPAWRWLQSEEVR
ncbi:hypothetical protein NDU88_001506 [Pleurodeles waltl]|uniref:Uncharacterized protein n=1 Tax=Pleurodeles waltl TaxID=8319 RepID=A0AAV7WLQ2_PLEWA|nr:hypothetical protein NDU88_001506 [Pleurodeles waltl]